MLEKLDNSYCINRKEFPGYFTACLLENEIIEVEFDKDFKEVDKETVLKLQAAFQELGEGKKMRIYFSTNAFMNITNSGREYASSNNAQHFTRANAILIDHLGKKLLFNFFLSVTTLRAPTKGFSTREEAIAWLLTIS